MHDRPLAHFPLLALGGRRVRRGCAQLRECARDCGECVKAAVR